MTPPTLAEALLRSLMPVGELSEAILGDMTEGWRVRAALDPSRADRWYWSNAIGSVPSLLGLWGRNASVLGMLTIVLLALGLRGLMLTLQYVAIAFVAALGPGPTNVATALAAVTGCVGSALVCGRVMRRVGGRTPGVAIIALCAACLVVHVTAPSLTHRTMPAWLYWLTASPLSAIGVLVGAAQPRRAVP